MRSSAPGYYCISPKPPFKTVIPIVLVIALTLVVIQPRLQRSIRRRAEAAGRSLTPTPGRTAALVLGTFLVGIYGGYFDVRHALMYVRGIPGQSLLEVAVMSPV